MRSGRSERTIIRAIIPYAEAAVKPARSRCEWRCITYRDASLPGMFEAVLPRPSLRYTASPTLTFYAKVAKGYIPGGFNLTAALASVPDSVLRYRS